MPDTAPLVTTIQATIPAQGTAGTAQDQAIDVALYAGVVTAVTFIPEADITGANTNYRTYRVVNKGTDGTGTTVVASLALTSGTNATAFDEKAITLSATAANLVVAAGDVLIFDETVTGNGLASPGGRVRVTISRS